jgi:uncharacterized protein (TIGR02453 family)
MIQKETFTFLKDIAKNNNKPWFDENKNRFKTAQTNVKEVVQEIENRLNEVDVIAKSKVFRIYRDVRFSKDKTPYKTYFHAYFEREGAERRGGYFLGIEPGKSIVGGGFYGPEKDDLFRIRKELEMDPKPLQDILNESRFKNHFGTLLGSELKTAPKGFDKDHPNIGLIRKKQFYAMEDYSDKEVMSEDYIKKVMDTYAAIRPFFDYMSEVLTTNLNGEKIV